MENLDSRKSIHSLAESVHSLLGLKTHLTSSWVDSVRNIIKTLPIKGPQRDHNNDDDSYNGVDLDSTIMRIKGELAALTAVIRQLNMLRREALNDYIDLKGNARVFCRVKPFTLGENSNQPIPVLPLDSSRVMLNFGANKSKIYKFDKVFHPNSSQDEFFQEVEPVIKSAMDGYNVCIFAYGQTGSGKTFTMEGTADNPGVIPRAIEAIYKQAADDNHTFILEFSMLEIYMGHLKDLLVPQSTKATNFRPPCPSMRSDSEEVEIDNLVTIRVSNFNQTKRLYRLGCRLRSTASTLSNEFSSRSHCMIRLLMTCVDGTERRRVRNKIWMVDLGGSERVLKTKAWGRRFEEGKAINLSLSALGDVINSLQKKNCHIPYRNSKLTQVLKDSLGEDSKTLMLVHVSPKEEDLCETVCSLNFATRVRSLHLGTEEPGEVKAQKEVELTSLQERMKWIEIKRHEVSIQISKLNEKLEHLMESPLSSSEELEVSHLSFQVELSESQTKPANNLQNVTAAPSLESPRFMRPTICSRRKSGINPEASGRKKLVPRGRRSSFHHAESLTSSGSIVSRTNCSVGSELRYSSDVETEVTEHSKDKSECDVKVVVCHLQDKPPRSSNHVKPYASSSVAQRNQKTNELNSSKYLKDNGLHVPKNASGISSTHWNMRVPAIPNLVNSRKGHLKGVWKTVHDKKLRNNKSPKKMIQQERLEKVDYLRADLKPRSGVKGQIIPTMNKDFSTHDSRIICNSPTDISDGIMMKPAQDMKDGFSCEDCICNTPPEWHGVFNDNEKDKSGVDKIQLIKYGREIAQSFLLKSSQTSISSLSDASGSITSITEDFDFPYSRSELRSTERIPYIIGNNREAAEGEDLLVDRARLVVLTHELQSQGRTKSIENERAFLGWIKKKQNEEEAIGGIYK